MKKLDNLVNILGIGSGVVMIGTSIYNEYRNKKDLECKKTLVMYKLNAAVSNYTKAHLEDERNEYIKTAKRNKTINTTLLVSGCVTLAVNSFAYAKRNKPVEPEPVLVF